MGVHQCLLLHVATHYDVLPGMEGTTTYYHGLRHTTTYYEIVEWTHYWIATKRHQNKGAKESDKAKTR